MLSGFSHALVLFISTSVFCKNDNPIESIAAAVNQFGDNLNNDLARTGGNVVFSPFSLHALLAFLTLGAAGRSQQELLLHLFIPNTDILTRGYFAILDGYLRKAVHNPKVSSALFFSEDYSLRKSFAVIAQSFFQIALKRVNFRQPKEAEAAINSWARSEFNQTAPAVDGQSFDPRGALLLMNAISFKGKWRIKFDKSKTEKNYAFNTPSGPVPCEMMVMDSARHDVSFAPGFSYLELSFDEPNVKIAFVSHSSSYTLDDLSLHLDTNLLFEQRKNLSSMLLEVKIPKVRMNVEYALKGQLKSIGFLDLFDNPDLSHLLQQPVPVQVTEVNQNTFVELNEDGAVATSITKAQLVARSTEIVQQFVLDEPFLFFIFDSEHNVVLIRGRVERPWS